MGSTEGTTANADGEFKGQRILVTGGTRGIGEAVTRRLRDSGATVMTTARSRPGSLPFPDLFVEADLATAEGCQSVAKAALDRLQGLDCIVHVVGGSSAPAGGFAVLNDEEWDRALNQNLLAAVRLDRALVPTMLKQASGVIIHVTSIQRRMPLPEATLAYAAAKAALTTYSKGLSREISPKGIRVLSVAPGFVETCAATNLIERLAIQQNCSLDSARETLMATLGGIPIGRPAKPEEVADLIAFVASPRAASINGTEYTIDGGTLSVV